MSLVKMIGLIEDLETEITPHYNYVDTYACG